jgi:predicted GNAT superfamily acetyltransferase
MTHASPSVRQARHADVDALCRINEASTPGVGRVTRDELAELMTMGAVTLVAEADSRPAGFILCLTEGAPYLSPNYRWISDRYPAFAYCDRIAVSPGNRGLRIGELLYRACFQHFAGRRASLLCEVNLEPPNPGSLRFHDRLGFRRIGEGWAPDRSKGVVYLEKALEAVAQS